MLLDYIQTINVEFHSPAYLKLSPGGLLLEHGGDIKRFGIVNPLPDEPVGKTLFFLDSFFPLKAPGIILPTVEVVPGTVADIHIFREGDRFIWVLFLDKTEVEKKFRRILEKSGRLQLLEEEYNRLLRDDIAVDILEQLEIAVFQQVSSNTFTAVGTLPRWFCRLFGKKTSPVRRGPVDLVHFFPFLEFFLAGEAAGLWKNPGKQTVISDLWIETDPKGKEIYLEAIAGGVKGKNILAIKPIDSQSSKNLLHIQRGREKSLAYERVVKAQKKLKEFMANMSHELRTPMNAVIGISKMLSRYFNENLTERQLEGLQMIHESGERLLHLINSLLDLSKIEAGRMTVYPEPMSINRLMDGLDKTVDSLLKDKDIRFNIETDPDIPEVVVADEEKLHQVLLNLLGNAVKFTERGEIGLHVYRRERRLHFEVRDTGIGIPEEHLPHIFEIFTQVQSSMAREYGGTGLGLTLCKKLVKLMNGEITVRSVPGQGSVFRFFIPLETEEPKIRESSPAGPKGEETPACVLIAEDERMGRVIFEMVLGNRYMLSFATSGREVVDLYFSLHPDVVLIDIDMPGMSGFEAFDSIRSKAKDRKMPVVPVVAVTAGVSDEEKKEILGHGFDGYLTKPVDEIELLRTIDNLLTRKRDKGETDE